jgi:tetratricopeptide (TPR) repeat protein
MRNLWLAALGVCLGCASAPIKPPDLSELEKADALVLQGCYDCLLEARDIYARVGVAKARPFVVSRLFEAELLITLREKELAIDAAASLARAQALVPELPPSLDAARALTIVAAIPSDDVGVPRRDDAAFRRERGAFIVTVENEIAWLRSATADPPPPAGARAGGVPAAKPGPAKPGALVIPTRLGQPVREYLALAVDCMYPTRPRGPGQPTRPGPPPTAPAGAPPLIVYRTAICRGITIAPLEKVRATVPRFVETSYFLGRASVGDASNNGGAKPKEQLTEAYARFPNSPSVTYMRGNINQLVGDCREALRYYEETLKLRPLHENGWLGQTVCLTYLKRTDDAIASATRMVEQKLDNTSDAYYWRAWNHYFVRKDLPLARRDTDSAKAVRVSLVIMTLAGIVENEQDDLDLAESDLTFATSGPDGSRNCIAAWHLGLVHMKRKAWLKSAQTFENAMGCYTTNVADAQAGLAFIQNRTDIEPEFKARQVASFQAAIIEDRAQAAAAAFNAANYFATGGEVAKAKVLIEVAARDASLADKVAVLRDWLKDK